MTNPYCPKCEGRGWYEGPYYGDFEPRVVKYHCEDCLPHSKPTKAEIVTLVVGFIILFGMMLRGAQ